MTGAAAEAPGLGPWGMRRAEVLAAIDALRETAEALGFVYMGAQGFAGMARSARSPSRTPRCWSSPS